MDADGELQETQHWLGRAAAYGYIEDETFRTLSTKGARIGGMLGKMIRDSDDLGKNQP